VLNQNGFSKLIKNLFQEAKLPPIEPEIKGYTTIWLSKRTKAKLNELRQKGTSYEDVINLLLEFYKQRKML
jgi:hypothetical protein